MLLYMETYMEILIKTKNKQTNKYLFYIFSMIASISFKTQIVFSLKLLKIIQNQIY